MADVSLDFELPISITNFMVPFAMSPNDFTEKWAAFSSETETGLVNGYVKLIALHSIKTFKRFAFKLLSDMNMSIIKNDGGEHECARVNAAATLCTGTIGEHGGRVYVGCMMKVEYCPKEGTISVEIRTSMPSVSKHIQSAALRIAEILLR
jgi:hypothetical protein